MILSGQESIQTNKYNYLKMLKDSSIAYRITNRVDSSSTVAWGESVLLGRKGTVDKPLYVHDKFWIVDTMYYTIVRKLTRAISGFFLSSIIVPI